MRALIHATSLVALFTLAGPVVAQPDIPQQDAAQKLLMTKVIKQPAASGRGSYVGACGDWFRCYSGIPLQCADNTRPYQNVASRECLCVHDGCPQH
jgi:hypothetical protein